MKKLSNKCVGLLIAGFMALGLGVGYTAVYENATKLEAVKADEVATTTVKALKVYPWDSNVFIKWSLEGFTNASYGSTPSDAGANCATNILFHHTDGTQKAAAQRDAASSSAIGGSDKFGVGYCYRIDEADVTDVDYIIIPQGTTFPDGNGGLLTVEKETKLVLSSNTIGNATATAGKATKVFVNEEGFGASSKFTYTDTTVSVYSFTSSNLEGYYKFNITGNDEDIGLLDGLKQFNNLTNYVFTDYSFLTDIQFSNDLATWIPFVEIIKSESGSYFKEGADYRFPVKQGAGGTYSEQGDYKYIRIVEGCTLPSVSYVVKETGNVAFKTTDTVIYEKKDSSNYLPIGITEVNGATWNTDGYLNFALSNTDFKDKGFFDGGNGEANVGDHVLFSEDGETWVTKNSLNDSGYTLFNNKAENNYGLTIGQIDIYKYQYIKILQGTAFNSYNSAKESGKLLYKTAEETMLVKMGDSWISTALIPNFTNKTSTTTTKFDTNRESDNTTNLFFYINGFDSTSGESGDSRMPVSDIVYYNFMSSIQYSTDNGETYKALSEMQGGRPIYFGNGRLRIDVSSATMDTVTNIKIAQGTLIPSRVFTFNANRDNSHANCFEVEADKEYRLEGGKFVDVGSEPSFTTKEAANITKLDLHRESNNTSNLFVYISGFDSTSGESESSKMPTEELKYYNFLNNIQYSTDNGETYKAFSEIQAGRAIYFGNGRFRIDLPTASAETITNIKILANTTIPSRTFTFDANRDNPHANCYEVKAEKSYVVVNGNTIDVEKVLPAENISIQSGCALSKNFPEFYEVTVNFTGDKLFWDGFDMYLLCYNSYKTTLATITFNGKSLDEINTEMPLDSTHFVTDPFNRADSPFNKTATALMYKDANTGAVNSMKILIHKEYFEANVCKGKASDVTIGFKAGFSSNGENAVSLLTDVSKVVYTRDFVVTFHSVEKGAEGDKEFAVQKGAKNTAITAPETSPVKQHSDETKIYKLQKWVDGDGNDVNFETAVITGDVDFYPVFVEETKQQRTITFKNDNGATIATVPVYEGLKIPAQTTPVSAKYENDAFAGWYNGENVWNFEEDIVNADVTLTAKYTQVAYKVADTKVVSVVERNGEEANNFVSFVLSVSDYANAGSTTILKANVFELYNFASKIVFKNANGEVIAKANSSEYILNLDGLKGGFAYRRTGNRNTNAIATVVIESGCQFPVFDNNGHIGYYETTEDITFKSLGGTLCSEDSIMAKGTVEIQEGMVKSKEFTEFYEITVNVQESAGFYWKNNQGRFDLFYNGYANYLKLIKVNGKTLFDINAEYVLDNSKLVSWPFNTGDANFHKTAVALLGMTDEAKPGLVTKVTVLVHEDYINSIVGKGKADTVTVDVLQGFASNGGSVVVLGEDLSKLVYERDYIVTFHSVEKGAEGDKEFAVQKGAKNVAITVPETSPVKQHSDETKIYKLQKWVDGDGNDVNFETAVITGDADFYPVFVEETKQQRTITFKNDNGATIATVPVYEGLKIPAQTTPVSAKYENDAFAGWYNGENVWNFEEDIVNADVTLTAKYTQVAYKVADTKVVSVVERNGEEANNFVSFVLSVSDYANAGTNTSLNANVFELYNFASKIVFKNANGEVIAKANSSEYILTLDGLKGGFAFRRTGNRNTNAIATVVIESGCQFPVFDNNGHIGYYETTEDITFLSLGGTLCSEDAIMAEGAIEIQEGMVRSTNFPEFYEMTIAIKDEAGFYFKNCQGKFDLCYPSYENYLKLIKVNGKTLYEINAAYPLDASKFVTAPFSNEEERYHKTAIALLEMPYVTAEDRVNNAAGLVTQVTILVHADYIDSIIGSGEGQVDDVTVEILKGFASNGGSVVVLGEDLSKLVFTKQYTVTFHTLEVGSEENETFATQTDYRNEAITRPETEPTKAHEDPTKIYKLEKWVDKDGNEIDFTTAVITGDTDIYPVYFEEERAKFEVKFVYEDETVISTSEVYETATATKPADPTKASEDKHVEYVFAGWFVGEEEFNFATPIMGATTITAKFTQVNYIFVTIDLSDGSDVVEVMIEAKEAGNYINKNTFENNSVAFAPSREGYTFDGWFVGETALDLTQKITADTTITAKWTEKQQESDSSSTGKKKSGCKSEIGTAIVGTLVMAGCAVVATKKKED